MFFAARQLAKYSGSQPALPRSFISPSDLPLDSSFQLPFFPLLDARSVKGRAVSASPLEASSRAADVVCFRHETSCLHLFDILSLLFLPPSSLLFPSSKHCSHRFQNGFTSRYLLLLLLLLPLLPPMIVVISTTAFRSSGCLRGDEEDRVVFGFIFCFSILLFSCMVFPPSVFSYFFLFVCRGFPFPFPSRREDRPSDDWWPRQDSVHLPHHTHSRKIRCPASRDCSSALHSRKTHCSPSCSENAEPSNRRPPNCAGCANTPWRSLHNTSPSFVSGVGAASPSNTSSAPSPSVVSRSSAARTY